MRRFCFHSLSPQAQTYAVLYVEETKEGFIFFLYALSDHQTVFVFNLTSTDAATHLSVGKELPSNIVNCAYPSVGSKFSRSGELVPHSRQGEVM
jgi:hypothetical protein